MADAGNNGVVAKAAAVVLTTVAVIGGLAAIVRPMQGEIDTLAERLVPVEMYLRSSVEHETTLRHLTERLAAHEAKLSHDATAGEMASQAQKFATLDERFTHYARDLERALSKITDLDTTLQREMRLLDAEQAARLEGVESSMRDALACQREVLELMIAGQAKAHP